VDNRYDEYRLSAGSSFQLHNSPTQQNSTIVPAAIHAKLMVYRYPLQSLLWISYYLYKSIFKGEIRSRVSAAFFLSRSVPPSSLYKMPPVSGATWGSRFTIASYYAVAIFSPFNMCTRAPSSSIDVSLHYWELWFGIMRYYKSFTAVGHIYTYCMLKAESL
jgi:hypothetical protein